MPWQESCTMDERTRFIGESLSGEWTMVELCERYGISRKTGYKWLGRYLPACSFTGRFRTPAPVPVAALVRAGIRKRSRMRNWATSASAVQVYLDCHGG